LHYDSGDAVGGNQACALMCRCHFRFLVGIIPFYSTDNKRIWLSLTSSYTCRCSGVVFLVLSKIKQFAPHPHTGKPKNHKDMIFSMHSRTVKNKPKSKLKCILKCQDVGAGVCYVEKGPNESTDWLGCLLEQCLVWKKCTRSVWIHI